MISPGLGARVTANIELNLVRKSHPLPSVLLVLRGYSYTLLLNSREGEKDLVTPELVQLGLVPRFN